jgi:hypothetical protein
MSCIPLPKSRSLNAFYDKWGKLSFDTNNFDEGWQGAEYPADVYYYWITYTDSDGGSQSQKGTVQLLR